MTDRALDHVTPGMLLPPIHLPASDGSSVDLATLPGQSVVAVYPWTGRPGAPNPPHWDEIHGAHGSTPELEGFRDLFEDFRRHGTRIFGLSRSRHGLSARARGTPGSAIRDPERRARQFQRRFRSTEFHNGRHELLEKNNARGAGRRNRMGVLSGGGSRRTCARGAGLVETGSLNRTQSCRPLVHGVVFGVLDRVAEPVERLLEIIGQ